MTAQIRDEQVYNNSTVNVGTNNGPTLTNDGRAVWSLVVRQGGGGTLTFAIQVSMDGANWIQAGPALSAVSGSQRVVYAVGSTQGPLVEPFIRTQAVVATSNATGVFADLVGI